MTSERRVNAAGGDDAGPAGEGGFDDAAFEGVALDGLAYAEPAKDATWTSPETARAEDADFPIQGEYGQESPEEASLSPAYYRPLHAWQSAGRGARRAMSGRSLN